MILLDWTKCFHVDYAPLIPTRDRFNDIVGKAWGDVDYLRELVNYGAKLSKGKEEIIIPVCEKHFLSVTVTGSVNSIPPADTHFEISIFDIKNYTEMLYVYNFDAGDVLKRKVPNCLSGEMIEFECETEAEVEYFYAVVCESLGVKGLATLIKDSSAIAAKVEPKYGGICRRCGTLDPYPEQGNDGKITCWRCCG